MDRYREAAGTMRASQAYQAADRVGLLVQHSARRACRSVKCADGVMVREIGWIIWRKDLRRWEVMARSDVDDRELATLIEDALLDVAKYGTTPGHGLRGRIWTHTVGDKFGRHAYKRVGLEVQSGDEVDTEAVKIPDDVSGAIDLLLESLLTEVAS